MISVTYIWHDGFLVTVPGANLVFDYWLDVNGKNSPLPDCVARLDRTIPLYVLVSHGHKDHFNQKIFAWANEFENVRFIVSRDVMKRIRHVVSDSAVYSGPKVDASAVIALRAGEAYADDVVKIAAFPSTDIGNSYMVEVAGMRIFHAGDLNAWIWKDESTVQEVRKALGDFRACLRDIRAWIDSHEERLHEIDYAFFPVDSRIGRDYFTGASEFVRAFVVGHFFPMHFALGDSEERETRRTDALRFDLYANPNGGEYIPLAQPGSMYLNCKK